MQSLKVKYDQLKVDMAIMQEKYESVAEYGEHLSLGHVSEQVMKLRTNIDEILELNYDDIRKNATKSEHDYLRVLKQKLIPKLNKHSEDTLRKHVTM